MTKLHLLMSMCVLAFLSAPTYADHVDPNTAPIVDAGPDQTLFDGDFLTLFGSAFDGDGDFLFYNWNQISGPPLIINNNTTLTAIVSVNAFIPSGGATAILQLQVYDGVDIVSDAINISLFAATSTVPIPGAVWLFDSGLIGLIGIAKRKKV